MELIKKKPRGILYAVPPEARFDLQRYAPSPELADHIERYWQLEWAFPVEVRFLQEVLPSPGISLSFSGGKAEIFGQLRKKAGYLFEGEGRAFSVKFKPAGFCAFCSLPMSELIGKRFGIEEIFGSEAKDLADRIFATESCKERIELTEAFLSKRRQFQDVNIDLANRIVAAIAEDQEILRVDDLLDRYALSKRQIQRLFQRYVGVSPKWVIMRYRAHEAIEQLTSGKITDLTELAMDLGYFDQAHFIKDFKALVGQSPSVFVRRNHPVIPKSPSCPIY